MSILSSILLRSPLSSGLQVSVTQAQGGTTSHLGELFYGWDFALTSGSMFGMDVLAIADGTVVFIEESVPDGDAASGNLGDETTERDPSLGPVGALGNIITLEHNIDGQVFYSSYMHLSQDSVPFQIGDSVLASDVVGQVGNTGVRTGTHLHVNIGETLGSYTNSVGISFPSYQIAEGADDGSALLSLIDFADSPNANGQLNVGDTFVSSTKTSSMATINTMEVTGTVAVTSITEVEVILAGSFLTRALYDGSSITQIFQLSTTWVEYEFTGLTNEVFDTGPPPVDLNGDGNLDIVLLGALIPGVNQQSDGSQQGLILLAQDGGGFIFADGDRPQTVSARYTEYADFNNDGYLDIMIVDHGWDSEPYPGLQNQLLLSDGNGGFTNSSHLLPDFTDFAHGLAVADVDNDGDIDAFIVVAGDFSEVTNSYLLINEGPDKAFTPNFDFVPDSISADGRDTLTTAFGDMNNDGFVDLIVGRLHDASRPELPAPSVIFWGDGTGQFSDENSTILPDAAESWAGIAHDMQPVDVDGDGDLDLMNYFVANPELSATGGGWAIQLLINHGDGVFVDETSERITGRTSSEYGALSFLHMSDLNGDGLMDFRPSVYSWWIEQADELVLQILATGSGTFETLTLGQIAEAHGVPEGTGDIFGFDEPAFAFGELLYSTSQGEALWSYFYSTEDTLNIAQFSEVQSTIIDLTLQANAHTPNWTGHDGNDLLIGDSGRNHLSGQNGNDQLIGSSGNDILIGSEGWDVARYDYDDTNGGTQGIIASLLANVAIDTFGDIDTLSGIEEISGSVFGDVIIGDAGANALYGRAGADTLDGGAGNDQLYGGWGVDLMFGREDDDTLWGGADGDTMVGGAGNDTLSGEVGVDMMFGGIGDDTLYGATSGVDSADTDFLLGQEGNDTLYGGGGSDVLLGGDDNDTLFGGDATDSLNGGAGADILVGGGGTDILFGGLGADVFLFATPSDGVDLIKDFASGEDGIALIAANFGLTATEDSLAGTGMFLSGVGLPADFGAPGTPVVYYETSSNALLVDATGGDSSDAVLIAILETGTLTESDVFLL